MLQFRPPGGIFFLPMWFQGDNSGTPQYILFKFCTDRKHTSVIKSIDKSTNYFYNLDHQGSFSSFRCGFWVITLERLSGFCSNFLHCENTRVMKPYKKQWIVVMIFATRGHFSLFWCCFQGITFECLSGFFHIFYRIFCLSLP